MQGRVIQAVRDGEGVKLFLLAEGGQAEAAHVADNSDVYLSSGETLKLRAAPAQGTEVAAGWPRYIAELPGGIIPKGTTWSTDRKQAVEWLKALARTELPALTDRKAALSLSSYFNKVRPLARRVEAATTVEDAYAVLLDIRAFKARPLNPLEKLSTTDNPTAGQVAVAAAKTAVTAAVDATGSVAGSVLDQIPDGVKIGAVVVGGILVLNALFSGGGGYDEE